MQPHYSEPTKAGIIHCHLQVKSALPQDLGHIPFAPLVDFAALITRAGVAGRLDPNSIEITNLATGAAVEYGRSEDFAYGDSGRLEWVIEDPAHTEYAIRFEYSAGRPPLEPQAYIPLVGVGDLLHYNAGAPRPLTLSSSMKLVDLSGDGNADLVGCWNYYHRPGAPLGGVVCYPRTGNKGDFTFGELVRLRYVETRGDRELKHFPGTYVHADFVDFDGDGLVDIVFAERSSGELIFFLNSGARDGGGWPIFVRYPSIPVPFHNIQSLRAVDVDGDGAVDLVINGHFIRNGNSQNWPFEPQPPVDLGAGELVDFLDVDGDGRLEMIALEVAGVNPDNIHGHSALTWQRQMAGEPLAFGAVRLLKGVSGSSSCSLISAVRDGGRRGVLLQCDAYQKIVFCELTGFAAGEPCFEPGATAASLAAVASWSDQAWPCQCDWNGDGVWDLLIGGGYGWPRLVLNEGSNERPSLREPEPIEAADGIIRVLRDDILHGNHPHNMGYPYPVLVDWDGDGLKDLLLPNETNRIVWYRNIGTNKEPRFGRREFLEVDGFADSASLRAASGRDGANKALPNYPYPFDKRAPFFWRTGAAFADWNGDGLMDFITHSWDRKATLFVQYFDAQGKRRLRLQGPVRLIDGRPIDDAIVGRAQHWTESFRAVDWNGDGRMDLLYNLAATGEIYLLRNAGTPSEPLFELPRQLHCYGEPIAFTIHGPHAWAGDFNGDGKPDLLGCTEWSVYPFYAHAALEMDEHPHYQINIVEGA